MQNGRIIRPDFRFLQVNFFLLQLTNKDFYLCIRAGSGFFIPPVLLIHLVQLILTEISERQRELKTSLNIFC